MTNPVEIALCCLVLGAGCATGGENMLPSVRGGVTLIPPRCAGVSSCLVGQVTAAESARPMARAAVFLQREGEERSKDDAVRILTLTDDQGVFTVEDAPRGKYRLAVYKDARTVQVRGLSLGERGTTMVPVRLPPAS